MVEFSPRHREILRLLWRDARLSRWELHERTGATPNAAGNDAAALIQLGLLRECPPEPQGPGRPRIPLEIDPQTRHVLGLAIRPGHVEVAALNLRGQLLDKPTRKEANDPSHTLQAAAELLRRNLSDASLAVGLSVTGFMDPARRVILLSSAMRGQRELSLQRLYEAAGDRPIILENDMHALAARWLLTHQPAAREDVLLVNIQDGQLGAAVLIEGRPNRGCAVGGNELGHTRFFVETDKCFCGHTGCLERICSTDFLQRRTGPNGSLISRVAAFDGTDAAVRDLIRYLAMGVANALNLIRPNRLVLASELARHARFSELLLRSIREDLLIELAERVQIDLWDQSAAESAETAGWLALASLYCPGWGMGGA